jgi:hypothetical protein
MTVFNILLLHYLGFIMNLPFRYIQGYSRVIMSPTELKMQPATHFRKKLDISIASFFRKCSVGCIFNSVGLIITRELPCRSSTVSHKF